MCSIHRAECPKKQVHRCSLSQNKITWIIIFTLNYNSYFIAQNPGGYNFGGKNNFSKFNVIHQHFSLSQI